MARRTVWDLNNKFGFGKYRDRTVADVLDKDPKYVEWVIAEILWFHPTDEVRHELKLQLEAARRFQ